MRVLDESALRGIEGLIHKEISGFGVVFKDESKLMALLGFLSYPFNPDFMSTYTTTLGKRVYFPSRSFYTINPAKSFRILAHEFVHLWDYGQHPLTFKLSYLFPQITALLPLVVYGVLAWPHAWIVLLPFVSYLLACVVARLSKILFWVVLFLFLSGTGVLAWWLTGWWSLWLLGVLLPALPWPSRWRVRWEVRGYGMNLAIVWWSQGEISEDYFNGIVRNFIGPGYYYMSWSGSKVRVALTELLASVKTQDIDPPYAQVRDFIHGG